MMHRYISGMVIAIVLGCSVAVNAAGQDDKHQRLQRDTKLEKNTNVETLETNLRNQLRDFENADGKRKIFLRKMLENLCQEAERQEYKSFRLQSLLEAARKALGRP